MADYTPWDVNSLLPGEPWTSAKAISAFENLDAVVEGAANAPRIYMLALERLAPGTAIRSRNDAPASVDGSAGDASVTPLQFDFIQYGTIRVTAQLTAVPISTNMTFRRIRSGASTTLATYTGLGVQALDVAVQPGDRLAIVLFAASTAGTITAQNFRFQTNGQDLWPGSSQRLEGNRTP